MIDPVYRKDENYYPKVFLEIYNLITIEQKISIFNENVTFHFNDSDEEYSDDSDEENSDRKIRMQKISCIRLFKIKARKIIN